MQEFWKKCLKGYAAFANNFEGFSHKQNLDEINKKILTFAKSLDLGKGATECRIKHLKHSADFVKVAKGSSLFPELHGGDRNAAAIFSPLVSGWE